MITPMSRLAALVTSSASAPISWSSRGSERQSTDCGAAMAFGKATADRPTKSNARDDRTGDCSRSRADVPERRAVRHGPRVPRRVPPIERDQPCGFRIVALYDARPAAIGVEPIEEFRQKGGPRAVDAIEPREVDVDRLTPLEPRLHIGHGRGDGAGVL
jgi:hypothetical protein